MLLTSQAVIYNYVLVSHPQEIIIHRGTWYQKAKSSMNTAHAHRDMGHKAARKRIDLRMEF